MKQKVLLIPSFLFIIGILFIIQGSFVQEEQINNDETMISITIDGSVSETFPKKESGKTISSITCDGEAKGSWDYEEWGPIVRINNNSSYITGYSSVNEPTCGYTRDNRDCNKYEGTSLNTDGTYTKRYNNETGYLASTTGNVTGIYDMSGGAWEYMMGVILHSNGSPCAGQSASNTSGFAGPYCNTEGSASGQAFPEKKYYDTYRNATDDEQYN